MRGSITDGMVEEGSFGSKLIGDLVLRANHPRQLWLRRSVFLAFMQRSRDRLCSGTVLASSVLELVLADHRSTGASPRSGAIFRASFGWA